MLIRRFRTTNIIYKGPHLQASDKFSRAPHLTGEPTDPTSQKDTPKAPMTTCVGIPSVSVRLGLHPEWPPTCSQQPCFMEFQGKYVTEHEQNHFVPRPPPKSVKRFANLPIWMFRTSRRCRCIITPGTATLGTCNNFVHIERANIRGLVLGRIEADFCNQIVVGKLRSTTLTSH